MHKRAPGGRLGGGNNAVRWQWVATVATIVLGAFLIKPVGPPAGNGQSTATTSGRRSPSVEPLATTPRSPQPTASRANAAAGELEQGRAKDHETRTETEISAQSIYEAAHTFREGKSNAFFNESAFVHGAFGTPQNAISVLQAALRRTEDLAVLPGDVDFMKDAPDTVVERMAMIDMLATLAKEDPSALEALADLAVAPLDESLPPQALKAMVGERYDALEQLARCDWEAASTAYEKIQNQAMRRTLRPALLSGLMNAGKTSEQAEQMVDAI